ncbi:hypothetical protein Leryth_020497 [Lithospermum erythrorhizon]|nr:hypothetical protein Leryth_020497 [Lithospermum erythrorhizon]
MEVESLSLLAQHAFDTTCSMDDFFADFKQVAKKTVKKCGYLPLAIKTIGRTLRGKSLLE